MRMKNVNIINRGMQMKWVQVGKVKTSEDTQDTEESEKGPFG